MDKFYRSSEFGQVRDAAHQRPSSLCGVPALIRNRSWWLEPTPRATTREEVGKSFSNERQVLDDFYTLLEKRIENVKTIKKGLKQIKRDDRFPRYHLFSGYWEGKYIRFLLSKHSNRVTFKQIIDPTYVSESQPDQRTKTNVTIALQSLQDAIEKVTVLDQEPDLSLSNSMSDDDYEKYVAEYSRIQNLREAAWKNTKAEFEEVAETLFDGIWHEFDRVLELPEPVDCPPPDTANIALFADFRGIVLPASPSWITKDAMVHPLRQYSKDDFRIRTDILHKVVATYWPLLKGAEAEVASSYGLPSKDVVACSVLDRAAIYVSTLGQTFSQPKGVERETQPIRYAVITATPHRHQIGRLVDRVDRLGIFRLLALRNLWKLRSVGDEIQREGIVLDLLAQSPTQYDDEWRNKLQEFGTKIQSLGPDIDGGLGYRIYRSRYYAESFNKLVKHLRIKRIEGFQPYDEFVERQLSQHYDFVDRLGRRIGDLRDRYLSLVGAYQTDSLNKLSNSLLKATTEGNEIRRIGMAVEFVVVTYYLGTMIYLIPKSIAGFVEMFWKRNDQVSRFVNDYGDGIASIWQLVAFGLGFFMWLTCEAWIKNWLLRRFGGPSKNPPDKPKIGT
jgi:hypothetical protein